MRPAPAVAWAGLALLPLALLGCGSRAATPVPPGSLDAASEARLEKAADRVLGAIDAHDDAALAAASVEIGKDGSVRRLAAADVREMGEALHAKYGQRATRKKAHAGEAPPFPAAAAWPVLVWFGEDEDLLKLWFVEESGELLLARISEEDPSVHADRAK